MKTAEQGTKESTYVWSTFLQNTMKCYGEPGCRNKGALLPKASGSLWSSALPCREASPLAGLLPQGRITGEVLLCLLRQHIC